MSILTEQQSKAIFGRGRFQTLQDWTDIVDTMFSMKSSGLKQEDLSTYQGTVGEIVEHTGDTFTVNSIKIEHGHIYERKAAIVEPTYPADSLIVTRLGGYREDYKSPDGGYILDENAAPTGMKEYVDANYPLYWIYDRDITLYGWEKTRQASSMLYAMTQNVSVGDDVILLHDPDATSDYGGFWIDATVTDVTYDSDWRNNEITVQYQVNNTTKTATYGGQPTAYYPLGSSFNSGVFTDTEGNEIIILNLNPANFVFHGQPLAKDTGRMLLTAVETNDGMRAMYQGVRSANYNAKWEVINTSVYTPTNIPERWERVMQLPSATSAVITLDQNQTSVFNLGKYDVIDAETIATYYTENVNREIIPNIMSIQNAGITANHEYEPLYVRTTALGTSYITVIPYGHAAVFTKQSDEIKYFPTTPSTTITEYELSELAQNENNSGYGYGYGYGENYGS